MFFPANYNIELGEALFDFTFRSRAYDNQIFAVALSPARDDSAAYVSWGHSYVADPFGQIVKQAGELEEVLCVDLGMHNYFQLICNFQPFMLLACHVCQSLPFRFIAASQVSSGNPYYSPSPY